MILLVDNYDSFSYNLVQLIGSICKEKKNIRNDESKVIHNDEVIEAGEIRVVRNDELTVAEVKSLNPSCIILSPGPGRPKEAGICEELIWEMKGSVKILGVCLGHQAICEVFGARITYAKELMHGRRSKVRVVLKDKLLQGLEEEFFAARYHSLAADPVSIPLEMNVLALAEDGEIMAVKHRDYEIYGLQFHPESILTPEGKRIVENFLNL